jgi:hypothetical protein
VTGDSADEIVAACASSQNFSVQPGFQKVRAAMLSPTVLELSRWQFAITIVFHMTFPAITVGLSIFLASSTAAGWLAKCPIPRSRREGTTSAMCPAPTVS